MVDWVPSGGSDRWGCEVSGAAGNEVTSMKSQETRIAECDVETEQYAEQRHYPETPRWESTPTDTNRWRRDTASRLEPLKVCRVKNEAASKESVRASDEVLHCYGAPCCGGSMEGRRRAVAWQDGGGTAPCCSRGFGGEVDTEMTMNSNARGPRGE